MIERSHERGIEGMSGGYGAFFAKQLSTFFLLVGRNNKISLLLSNTFRLRPQVFSGDPLFS